jgi:hypothetical protein
MRGLADTDSHEFLRIGDRGYTIPWLHLTQLNVPTKYDLAGLSLGDFHQALNEPTVDGSSTVSNAQPPKSHVGSGVSSFLSVATGIGSAGVEATSAVRSDVGGNLQPQQTPNPSTH